MRCSASGSMLGPTSLSTRRCSGVPGSEASAKPISPPIEVPTQSIVRAFRRASSTTISATYWGRA